MNNFTHQSINDIITGKPAVDPIAQGVEAICDFVKSLQAFMQSDDAQDSPTKNGHLVLVLTRSTDQMFEVEMATAWDFAENDYLLFFQNHLVPFIEAEAARRMREAVSQSVDGKRQILLVSHRTYLRELQIAVVTHRISHDLVTLFYISPENGLYKIGIEEYGTFTPTAHGQEFTLTSVLFEQWRAER